MSEPRRTRLEPSAVAAASAFLLLLALALFGERLAPHEPIYFVVEHGTDPRPYDPGLVFPFGSDVLGRDLFSLVLAGAQATLTIVLLAGAARVAAGLLVATLGSWWRPTRVLSEVVGELVSAVPATIVALVIVKVFVKADTSVTLFIAALLVIGWAGPYRVIRAEVDRLAAAPFTEGARAIGVGRWQLFWRHQLPHLVPILAANLTQQVVASLVLVAELGVLGAIVGSYRSIDIEESLGRVVVGQVNAAPIATPVEWGGLLANARTIESLWTTRWLFLVPGLAFGITALILAVAGFALARRYARRDVYADIRGPGAVTVAALAIAMFVVAGSLPERYAEAREWAAAARAEIRGGAPTMEAFAKGGLRPIAGDYAIERRVDTVIQTDPATVSVGSPALSEPWPRRLTDVPDRERNVRSFVTSKTGGGVLEAPLVFAGRGISAGDYQPLPRQIGAALRPDFAQQIRDFGYADDYEQVDVRGKVVLLVRFLGIRAARVDPNFQQIVRVPDAQASITNAIKRGAAGVIFVDPALWLYHDLDSGGRIYGSGELVGGMNPYLRAERSEPPTDTGGVPVVILSEVAAKSLLDPLGLDLAPFYALDEYAHPRYRTSVARDLGVSARVEVPLRRETASVTSYVGEIPAAADDPGQVLVWSIRRPDAPHPAADVVAALAQALGPRKVPFVLVDFDPSIDARANARHVRDALGERRISLVVVLDGLEGAALRFTTPSGELIPALDLYAEKSGARYARTSTTARIGEVTGLAPFFDLKTVLIRGTGGEGDPRPDAAALIGYLAGRMALGAPEVPR